jgi:hypothetical protein
VRIQTETYGFACQKTRGGSRNLLLISDMRFLVDLRTEKTFVRSRKNNERILLVNPLQSSRSTFSRGSLFSFFAFNEGMLGTPISVLGG